jgi:hypothetical protein
VKNCANKKFMNARAESVKSFGGVLLMETAMREILAMTGDCGDKRGFNKAKL